MMPRGAFRDCGVEPGAHLLAPDLIEFAGFDISHFEFFAGHFLPIYSSMGPWNMPFPLKNTSDHALRL